MKRRRKTWAAVGILLAVLLAVAAWNWQALLRTYTRLIRAYATHYVTSVNSELGSCDRVEVFQFVGAASVRPGSARPQDGPRFPIRPDGYEVAIAAQTTLHGADAQALVSLWRSQTFGWEYMAACHKPAYGFRYYSGSKLLFETSVCFECSTFSINPVGFADYWGFDTQGPKGQELLQRLQQLFPDSIRKQE